MHDEISRAFMVTDALSRIGGVGKANTSEGSIHALTSELARSLETASSLSPDADVRRHLELRAEAVTSRDFDRAVTFGATRTMPFEMVLSPSPHWTHPTSPGALSGMFGRVLSAHPVYSVLDATDLATANLSMACLDTYGLRSVERAFDPPIYSVCDLELVAGQAAVPPFHFASFLPEDEGERGVTSKTLVFQNLYLLRFVWISHRLAEKALGEDRCDGAPQVADVVLPQWLRAHDMAHSYFDNVCRSSGLSDKLLHAIREVLADTVADAAVLNDAADDGVLSVIIGEKLRYARRDPAVFADSLAARLELGWLTRYHGLGSLTSAKMSASAVDLVDETVARLVNGDLGRFESWARKLVAEWVDPEMNAHTVPDDVVPLFADDNAVLRAPRSYTGCGHHHR
ncbi:MAG TPA: hypothetical protein VIH71_05060 [Solirubrobacteraceae bacterium]